MNLHKRVSLLLSSGIMWIGLITFCINSSAAAFANNRPVDDNIAKPNPTQIEVTATPTPTPEPTPVPNNLQCEQIVGIHNLVETYLKAKLTCTYEAFEGIVTDPYLVDLEDMQRRTEAITAYKDITCYTKRGFGAIDYVVYFTYSMDIVNIDEPVFAVDSMYVTTADAADGSYRVFYGDLDHDTVLALSALNEDDDVQELISAVYTEMEAAAAANESVLEFWRNLYESEE